MLVDSLTEVEGMTSICVNINKEKTNRILGSKIEEVYGKPYIYDYIGNVKYQIGPLSFFQVNPTQTKVLYEKAMEYADLKGEETVWDLYCGIGTISIPGSESKESLWSRNRQRSHRRCKIKC